MKQAAIAVSIGVGALFVRGIMWVGTHQMLTPLPALIILPGVIAGGLVPGAHFDFKDNGPENPPALIFFIVFYAVNIALYRGLLYLLLGLAHRALGLLSARR